MSISRVSIVICVVLFYQLQLCEKVSCSIISQSSISICEAGDDKNPKTKDGSPCKDKMLVSMTLRGGQGETESLYANIDQVYEKDKSELSRLRKPFRIEVSKTVVTASYRVHYIGTANARPDETSITKKKCKDGWYEDITALACGKQIGSDGEEIWDSQGFCCKCKGSVFVKLEEENERGDLSCGSLSSSRSYQSAHCFTNNELWYNIFDVGPPMLQYNITVRLLEFKGILQNNTDNTVSADWDLVSTFYLNPTRTISRSRNGEVLAEIEGSLLGVQGPSDFSYKNLLIPSIQHWTNETLPPQYTNGPSDWMLVDKHMIDLTGTVCNKVGVSYSGFRHQPGRCNRDENSCFTNQPLDFWEHDNLFEAENKTGLYLLKNFGTVDHESSHPSNTSFILKMLLEDLHNTFVTMRIDATDLYFVQNVGSGRIVDTYAIDFEALSGKGEIVVIVENTGEVTADFSVSVLKCNTGVHTVSAKTVAIDPGENEKITFIVQSYKAKGTHYECEIQLYDSDYNLLQTGTVNFKTNSTCFCFGLCGCTCEGEIECPNPPPIHIKPQDVTHRVVFLILETIGLHGIVGIVGGILIVLGFTKLMFGSILFCRKTKAQKFAAELKEQGVVGDQGPMLVRCSSECDGARAAQERFKRKAWRLKQMGKKINELDDWRNYSYSCTCHNDLVDIRFVEVLKTIFFFYYCLLFPCIWLGKKVIWGVFKDTAVQKQKAIKRVLKRAKKKGKQAKYGIIENEEYSKLEEQKQQHKDSERKETTKNKKNNSSEMNDKSNEKQLKGQKKKLKTKSSNSGDHHETNNSYDNGGSDSTMNNEYENNGQDGETKPLLGGILDTEQSSIAEQKVKKKRRGKKRPNKPHSRRSRHSNKNKSSHSESESNSDQSVSNSDVSDDGSESAGNDTESVLINIK